MTIPTRDWLTLLKFGTMILAVFALQSHLLLAQTITETKVDKTALVAAYTDYSSPAAQEILWLSRGLFSQTQVKEEQIMVALAGCKPARPPLSAPL